MADATTTLKNAEERQFKKSVNKALSNMKEKPIPKTIHMIWIGTKNLSDENVRKSMGTAAANPQYKTRILYDSGIAGHEKPRKHLEETFAGEIDIVDVRNLPYFSKMSAHPAFALYEKVVAEKKYAQASDLLRLLLLAHEGGIYKDIDDTQERAFGELSLPAGLGFKREYTASQGMDSSVPNTPIAATADHEVINRTLELAVSNYADKEKQSNVLKLAGPDVFNEALKEVLPLTHEDVPGTSDIMKMKAYNRFMVKATTKEVIKLAMPREKMLQFGAKVSNGSDNSWRK